jgi:PAS domain S-box-containing protein
MSKEFRLGSDPLSKLKEQSEQKESSTGHTGQKQGQTEFSIRDQKLEGNAVKKSLKCILTGPNQEQWDVLDVLESLDFSLLVISKEKRILYSNKYFKSISGYSEEEILGKVWPGHYLEDFTENSHLNTLNTSKELSDLICKDGQRIPVQIINTVSDSPQNEGQEYILIREVAEDYLQASKQKEIEDLHRPDPAFKLQKLINLICCLPLKSLQRNIDKEFLQLLDKSSKLFQQTLLPYASYFSAQTLNSRNVEYIIEPTLQAVNSAYTLDDKSFSYRLDFVEDVIWQRDRVLIFCFILFNFLYTLFARYEAAKFLKDGLYLKGYADVQGDLHLICQSGGFAQNEIELNSRSMNPWDFVADILVHHQGGMLLSDSKDKYSIRFILPNTPIVEGFYEW